MKNKKLFIQFILSGALGAFVFWLLIEPWTNDYGFYREWMILFFVATGITIGLTTIKYIIHGEFSGIFYVLKRKFIYVILLITTLLITYLFSTGTASVQQDMVVENRILLLDTSGSMQGGFTSIFLSNSPIKQLKKAVQEYLQLMMQSQSKDVISCITFSQFSNILHSPTNNYQSILQNIDGISANGGTNMLDGLKKSTNELEKSENNYDKEIILVSDGMPEKLEAVVEYIKSIENIKISTIGVGQSYHKELLQFIANETNGKFFPADNVSSLTTVFKGLGGLTKKSNLAWWKMILGWSLFGMAISSVIAYVNNCDFEESVQGVLPGGLIGGIISSIFFMVTTNFIATSSSTYFRGTSFVILGIIIGLAISFNLQFYSSQNPNSDISERIGGIRIQ